MHATLGQKSVLDKFMLYTAGKMKGPEQAPRFMDVPGSSGVSKRAGGDTELTPAMGTEERSRESRTQRYL